MGLPVNQIIQGDATEVLKKLPDNSIDCIITSPPYWGLRDYGKDTNTIWGGAENCEHEWVESLPPPTKLGLQGNTDEKYRAVNTSKPEPGKFCKKCGAMYGRLGLEPTPEMFVDHLIEIFREIKRVLKSHGNVFVVIDDTYSGSGKGYGSIDPKWPKARDTRNVIKPNRFKISIPNKSLCLVPEMFAIRMVYDLGFILRQKLIWTKKVLIYKNMETMGNGMPESARDRQPHNWEYIYHFVKKPKYWYDQDTVRMPYTKPMNRWGGRVLVAKGKSTWDEGTGEITYRTRNMRPNPLGANAPDTLLIDTKPFPEAHFAVFPERLVEFLLKVGCPEQICKKCGKPRERIVKVHRPEDYDPSCKAPYADKVHPNWRNRPMSKIFADTLRSRRETTGWTDCGCGAGWKSGIVLDPFIGSGTTALVALKNGRDFIGIELNKEYIKIAEKRIKPYIGIKRLTDFEDKERDG
jgi:DNA modification methylase